MPERAEPPVICQACGIDTERIPEVAVESAAAYFHERPYDANPYNREVVPECWASWRFGWREGSALERLRGETERKRWLREAA